MSLAVSSSDTTSGLQAWLAGIPSKPLPSQIDPDLAFASPLVSIPQLRSAARATENLGNRRRIPERWNSFEARIARDRRTRADAFRLRHLCYSSKGYIDARPDGQFSDEYDAETGNTTVVIYEKGQPIGSVRVCTMSPERKREHVCELPVAHVFPSDVKALLTGDAKAVEINRLVSHPDHAHSQGLVFILIRMADYVIRRHNPDFIASCVRSNHVGFYKRLQFEQVAGPRQYHGVSFMTTFMVLRRENCDMVRRIVPVLRISPSVSASYEDLWSGSPVAVFGNE